MDLSPLNTKSPLGDKLDRIGEFVNVKRFDSLKVCGTADVPLQILLEWSPDGLQKAMEDELLIPADQWKFHKFEVVMPFVRMHIINKSTGKPLKPNKNIQIVTTTQGGPVSAAPEPVVDQEKRAKSPIRKFIDSIPSSKQSGKRDHRPTSVISPGPVHDIRIPDYIPEGVILIGGKSGRIQLLPRGNPGEVLAVNNEGKLVWLSINAIISQALGTPMIPDISFSAGPPTSSISSELLNINSRTPPPSPSALPTKLNTLQSSSFDISKSKPNKISFSSITQSPDSVVELPSFGSSRIPSKLDSVVPV